MENEEKWLDTVSTMSKTIGELATEKDQKVKSYKTIIICLIAVIVIITTFYACSISYFIYNIYNYDYSVTNVNKNINQNGGTSK